MTAYKKQYRRKHRRRSLYSGVFGLLVAGLIYLIGGYYEKPLPEAVTPEEIQELLDQIPEPDGAPYCEVNGNVPFFTEADLTEDPFETYSELDFLGRCGPAYANLCEALMPEEERGSIGMIRPSGWQTVKYEGIDGKYLYNRCHLIGYQLAGENDNERNLITGTRYLNVTGMLPFENETASHIYQTGHHVLYRVTPIFEGQELVARGVLMEARCVEGGDADLSFCVFCYNVQPGIIINYADGTSKTEE